jgi:hypothetical protein
MGSRSIKTPLGVRSTHSLPRRADRKGRNGSATDHRPSSRSIQATQI